MWPRKGLEKVHYGGEGPHWAVVPMKKNNNNGVGLLEDMLQ